MLDFGESDKMIKIGGKSNTYNGFSSNISFFFFIHGWTSSGNIFWVSSIAEKLKNAKNEEVLPLIKNEISLLNPL